MLEHTHAAPIIPDRVVIIGAGGFVGGAIAKQLTAENIPVLPIRRMDVDLLADDASKKLQKILHSGDSLVFISAQAPAKTVTMLMDNLRMAEPVCHVLASLDIAQLVYISSDAVYADEANPVSEESSLAPTTLHGMMHAARELMLKSSTKAPVACLRPTLIYGKADPHNGYGPNRFRRQAEKGEPVQIFGEGEEQRDHVLVDDVAKIASLVLTHHSVGSLNVVTGVSTSFYEIATLIAKQFGGRVVSQPRPGPRPHHLHRFFNPTNGLKAFPTFQYTPLSEGLLRVL